MVTGASRGAGRGIATELGAAGATVYVTGRSTRSGPRTLNTRILVRRAKPSEAEALSALALRSKAHWGYDPDFIARCREALTVTEAMIASHDVFVAESSGRPLGFYVLKAGPADEGVLDFMFVDPVAIGQGLGERLWRHAVQRAAGHGYKALRIDADPHAEGFYRRMGAVRVGEVASTVDPGRMLPLMRYRL